MVGHTNLAWDKAEVLNERVSPPKSVYATGQHGLEVAIHYSAPSVKHRTIWDSLVMLDEVWRTGANEANVIEFSHDVHIGEKHLKAGSYSLFSIPKANGWTLIINSVANQWGAFEYDASKDVARFELPNMEVPFTELLSFNITKLDDEGLRVAFAWEKRGFEFDIYKAGDMEEAPIE